MTFSSLLKLTVSSFNRCYFQGSLHTHEDSLSYNIEVEPQCQFYFIPRNLLFSFVRNSMVHGIRAKGKGHKGHINIRFRQERGLVMITVEDDGVGIPEGWELSNTPEGSTGKGIGLSKILVKYLKEEYRIRELSLLIQNRNKISPELQGTIVSIKISILSTEPTNLNY